GRRGRQKKTRVALVDNGSLKPEATKSLRRLAASLQRRGSWTVEAVSARFADKISKEKLDGKPGEVLGPWLKRVAEEEGSQAKVLLLPLLIGPSDTLTKTMPEAALGSDLQVDIAPSLVCLCPAIYKAEATGATEMAEMLTDKLGDLTPASGVTHVFLCDHGSPAARVAAAREAVRSELEVKLGRAVTACCMERREGPEYDFNGPLLEDALKALPTGASAKVALLFLQEGRHAGPGGDIAKIVEGVLASRKDLKIETTGVLAGHAVLEELLLKRAQK
ncbi:unnamed protein product, partial [Symbiodinium pilosum]